MKRILSIITVFLLAVTLVACGKSKEIEEVKETLGVLFEDPDNIKSGFVLPTEFNYDVKGTWQSSDVDFLQIGQADDEGMVQVSITRPAHDKEDKKVKLSVDLELGKKKDTWSIELTIKTLDKPAYEGDSFKEGIKQENNGKTIMVNNVALYYPQGTNGYYLSTADGVLAYVNRQANMPKAGKLYNITATVDNYFNSLQLKDVNYTEVEGTPAHNVVYKENTITNMVDVEKFPQPSNDNVYGHDTFKFKNVKIIVSGTGNYNTFLVDKDFDETKKPTKENSLLLYYHVQIEELRAIKGLVIDEIDLVLEGYRTDLDIWYFSYLKPMEELKIAEVTDTESVKIDSKAIVLPKDIFVDEVLNLPNKGVTGSTITWTVDETSIIDVSTGKVTAPKTEVVVVKLTGKFVRGEAEEVKVYTINVGDLAVSTIKNLLDAEDGNSFRVEGVVTSLAPYNSFTVEDATGAFAFRIGGANSASVKFKVGDTINAIVKRNTFNGLIQGELVGGVEAMDSIKITTGGSLPTPTNLDTHELDLDGLKALQSKLVSLNNLLVISKTEDNYKNISMTLQRADGKKVYFKWDARVEMDENPLLTVNEGDFVNLVGVPVTVNNNNVTLMYDQVTQVVKATPTDEVKTKFDLLTLAEGLVFEEAGELPEKGLRSKEVIEWSFKNADDANKNLIDLTTRKVTIKPETRVEVILVAKIGTITQDVKVTIGEHIVQTIDKAVQATDGTELMIKGVVTNKYGNETYGIQDETGSIALHSKINLTAGKEVTLVGTRNSNNGSVQLSVVEVIESTDVTTQPVAEDITALVGTEAELKSRIGKLITIKGAEVTVVGEVDKYQNIDITVEVGATTLVIKYDSRANDGKNATDLEALEVGDIIDITTNVGWFNGAQLGYGPKSNVVVEGAETPEPSTESLIIYELYGGGGNSGAIYTYDYVVLYNGTDKAIDLSTYTLQYASATKPFNNNNIHKLTGSIASKGYYLIQLAAGNTPVKDLDVEADFIGTLALGAKAGKVVLANNETLVDSSSSSNVVDFVGFGGANDFEGTKAPEASNSTSLKRETFIDTNDNGVDFKAVTPDLSYLK